MGRKLRNILTPLLCLLSVVIFCLAFNHENVSAATNYGNADMVTSGTIDDQNKTYSTGSTVPLTIGFDSNGHKLQSGDTLTIDIPDPLTVKPSSDTFEVLGDDGEVIGTAKLGNDNKIVITFSDAVNDMDTVKGELKIGNGVTVDANKAEIGDNDVAFEIIDGKFDHSNLKVKEKNNDKNISKKGVFGTDADGNAIVTWTILANRNNLNFGDMTVTDNITDSNLTYVPGSVVVQNATWVDKQNGSYKRGSTVSSDKYALKESDNGFELSIPDANTQMYAIIFQTRVTDESKVTDGTVFENYASLEGKITGSGTDPSIIQEEAYGKVAGNTNGNSGSGSGNKLGGVTLTKYDENNHQTLLNGAVYDLYQVGSDEPVQTNLTTDENGQIKLTNLKAGDYYFKEVKAPAGYQLNNNEILFTITGQTTTPVEVSGYDEPEKEQLGSIVIQKIDAETGYKLAGAEFNIVDEKGNVVGTITTDRLGLGHYYNLPIGKYKLVETKAPEGYLKGDDIDFEITADNLTPELISVENLKELTGEGSYGIVLHKYDADKIAVDKEDKVGVPGAEYTLYDENGTVITTAITNELGVIRVDNLPVGNYYFKETKAPDGFDINDDEIHFSITADENGTDLDALETSDPKTVEPVEPNPEPTDPETNPEPEPNPEPTPEPNPNPDPEPTDPEPGDNNGGNVVDPGENGNGTDTDDNNNLIVDPNHPDTNDENNEQGGVITLPSTDTNNNSNNDASEKLPQTGSKSGLAASLLGLVLLSGIVYFKRQNA
ncbi:SpaA isopeptide-forming pilin-related protein [Companilactobacillus suantsaicola]|uniref:SpaA isopeptide-forming pilin-related protein n=1 Tax=Companilactobacillus suantsaicola TaxID=2487723 RepID=UPI001436AB1E|nr:SpaA isopeptide-forming pilin-related protein [Companilactobacillus suantsaicola]